MGALMLFAGCDSGAGAASASPSADASEAASPAAVVSEAAAVESSEPAASDEAHQAGEIPADLATPNPAYETLSITGVISSINDELDVIYIKQDADATGVAGDTGEIGVVEGEDCITIDAQTGADIDEDTLQVGDRVQAFIGLNMTRSIPPQAPCFALMTNIPADTPSNAHYIRALQVTQNTDGSVTVLNQNADTLVTIPTDLTIEVYDETRTAQLDNIVAGTPMIAWYDMETRSIPAQATATRVMIDIDD